MNIIDRLRFDQVTLSNGMKGYVQHDPGVQFAHLMLTVPYGSSHNYGDVIPGSYHFLEHMVMKRSELFPNPGEAMEKITMLGGDFTATTSWGQTSYEIKVPTKNLNEMTDAIISHVFHPIFIEEDVIHERTIIQSERKRKEAFHPGMNAISHYLLTEVMNGERISLKKIFGSDEDHIKITADYLKKLHQKYFGKGTYFILVGNFNDKDIYSKLEAISLVDEFPPPIQLNPLSWKRKEFHEYETPDVGRFQYQIVSLYKLENLKEESLIDACMDLVMLMLTNYSYGVLMKWLRHEKGWSYEIERDHKLRMGDGVVIISIPLSEREYVDVVRTEILSRIEQALSDEELLEKAKAYQKGSLVFWYQTPKGRLNNIHAQLDYEGSIQTETEYVTLIDSITIPILQNIFEKYIKPNIGEVLLVPKK